MATIETYVPLYRKYRPQQFSDLVGQEVVSTAIGNAMALNKIAHAYLFCGPRGTGKTSSARIFAKSLNCIEGPTITPCQVCPSCVAITNGNALDVTEIDAASNNSVNDIRDLTEKVQFASIQGKYKIYIIDEVHMLSAAAFNALLKTLEEPPPNVVFIFATTEPHKVLPTIISRCQRFDFSRITRSQIEARLAQVAEWEGIQITPEALTLIARSSKGGLRDALGLLDQVAVLGRTSQEPISPQTVRRFIGILEEDLLLNLTQGILEKNPGAILAQINQLQEKGIEPNQMTKELIQHFRNLLIAKTCGSDAIPEDLDISPELYPKLVNQTQGFELEELPQMLMRLSLLENQLRHSQQPQLWFEVGLLDLCYRQEIHLLKDLSKRIEILESQLSNGQSITASKYAPPVPSRPIAPSKPSFSEPKAIEVPKAMPGGPKPASGSALDLTNGKPAQPLESPVTSSNAPITAQALSIPKGSSWADIVENIGHMPTKALVKDHFTILEVNETHLVLGYFASPIYEIFKNSPEKCGHLEEAVRITLGKPLKLSFKLSPKEMVSAPSQPSLSPQAATTAPVINRPESSSLAPEPMSPKPMEALPGDLTPRYDTPPEKPPLSTPVSSVPPAIELSESMDSEIQQAKQYTQELLQGKLLD